MKQYHAKIGDCDPIAYQMAFACCKVQRGATVVITALQVGAIFAKVLKTHDHDVKLTTWCSPRDRCIYPVQITRAHTHTQHLSVT